MKFVCILLLTIHFIKCEIVTFLYQKNLPSKEKFLINYAMMSSNAPLTSKKAFGGGHCGMLCMSSINPLCLGFKFEGNTKICTLLFSSFDPKNNATVSDLDSFYGKKPVCPSNFVFMEVENKCYYLNATKEVQWIPAQGFCNKMNSHQVVIDNQSEAKLIGNIIANCPLLSYIHSISHSLYLWTAGRRVDPVNISAYKWMVYENLYWNNEFWIWGNNQPDNYLSNEYCLHLYEDAKLNDGSCQNEFFVLCEIDLP